MPRRGDLASLYSQVMDAAGGKPVDLPHARYRVRQGAALHEARRRAEPRAGLARDPGRARQARRDADAVAGAAAGGQRAAPARSCSPSSPRWRSSWTPRPCPARGPPRAQPGPRRCPRRCTVGAMLETPSMAFAPRRFFEEADFISIGGQRPQAVLLRRRPRERARAPPLRHAERLVPVADRADRGALRRDRHAGLLLRRGCGPPDRGPVLRRDGPAFALSMRPASARSARSSPRRGRAGRNRCAPR